MRERLSILEGRHVKENIYIMGHLYIIYKK